MSDMIRRILTKENLLIVVLCGVLLFVAALPTKNTVKEISTKQTAAGTGSSPADRSNENTTEQYTEQCEKKLESMLTEIETVGKVKVCVTVKTSEEIILQDAGIGSKDTVRMVKAPRVEGILVVAQGAGRGDVDRMITDIAKALFDVEANKVVVAPMKKEAK